MEPGATIISGRYLLQTQLRCAPFTTWRATDTVLAQPARVIVVPSAHREEILDAARRASRLDDPRFVKIREVSAQGYIITDPLPTLSLAQVAACGGHPHTQAVVAEVADALENAHRLGLRHLCLSPQHVYIAHEVVTIDGLATFAAAQGRPRPDESSLDLSREDALGLVALWAAVRVQAPSENSDGSPAELELGPDPADMPEQRVVSAAQVARWLAVSAPVAGDELAYFVRTHFTKASVPASAQDTVALDLAGTEASLEPSPADTATAQLATPASSRTSATASGAATEEIGAAVEDAQAETAANSLRADADAPSKTSLLTATTQALSNGAQSLRRNTLKLGRKTAHSMLSASSALAKASAPTRAKISKFAAHHGRRQINPAKWVVGIASVALVLVFGLSLWQVTRPLQAADYSRPTPTGRLIQVPSVNPEQATKEAPQLAGVSLLNPHADEPNQDDARNIGRVADGDPHTIWRSWWYQRPDFNGTPGLGIQLQLAKAAAVHEVVLHLDGEGGQVQWRLATQPDNADTVVAKSPLSADTTLKAEKPQVTEHIVLWFTALPKDSAGRNRLNISEIEVR